MHPTNPTFTIANKDHKPIHIHENTFVLLEGGVSIQQTSFQAGDKTEPACDQKLALQSEPQLKLREAKYRET